MSVVAASVVRSDESPPGSPCGRLGDQARGRLAIIVHASNRKIEIRRETTGVPSEQLAERGPALEGHQIAKEAFCLEMREEKVLRDVQQDDPDADVRLRWSVPVHVPDGQSMLIPDGAHLGCTSVGDIGRRVSAIPRAGS